MVTLRVDEAKRVCDRAVAVARAAGNAEIECHATDSLGVTNVYMGDLEVGLAQLRSALDLALDQLHRRGQPGPVEPHRCPEQQRPARGRPAGRLWPHTRTPRHGLARSISVTELAEGGLALYRQSPLGFAPRRCSSAYWRHAATGVPQIMVEERLAMLDVGRDDTGGSQPAGRHAAAHERSCRGAIRQPARGGRSGARAHSVATRSGREPGAAVFERRLPAVPPTSLGSGHCSSWACGAEADASEGGVQEPTEKHWPRRT